MTRPAYFVIHGAMRTGSNLLEKTLEALGDTVCHGEAFNPAFIGGPRRTEALGWTLSGRDADPFGFLAAMLRSGPGRIHGFRIFQGHSRAIAAHTLSDPDCARIVLRRDPLHAYVSLKIARTTGQWMLRNARRRRIAAVRFDGREFETYRARQAEYYAWIDAEMERARTAALRIDYADLQRRSTALAAARHIGSSGEPPESAPILRQNPERLADKVENYAELCDWLGRCPDPPLHAAPQGPGKADLLLSRALPLAHAPVDGPALAPALALVQRLEAAAGGGEAVPPARLAAEPAAHFQLGADAASALGERFVFALVCHPAARLHGILLDALFGPGWHGSPVRRAIAARVGGIPSLRAIRRSGAPFPAELHRAAFAALLDLVAEASAGRGPLAGLPAAAPQSQVVRSWRASVGLDLVGRLEGFDALAEALAAACGQAPLPPGQVAGIRSLAFPDQFPLERILDRELAAAVRRLHGGDHAEFGYDDLPAPG